MSDTPDSPPPTAPVLSDGQIATLLAAAQARSPIVTALALNTQNAEAKPKHITMDVTSAVTVDGVTTTTSTSHRFAGHLLSLAHGLRLVSEFLADEHSKILIQAGTIKIRPKPAVAPLPALTPGTVPSGLAAFKAARLKSRAGRMAIRAARLAAAAPPSPVPKKSP